MSGGNNSAHTESKIGRTLELARKERGLSLKQVEEATKIRAAYLAELEQENFGVLPAVYVQGSLKTYANFLQLDGEEMVRELKRQQAPREEPSYPLYVGPREDDSLDDTLVAIGGAAGVAPKDEAETEAEDEVDARPALLPRGIATYLYLGSAVVVVVAMAAAALALTVAEDSRLAVSQVREPLISQAPKTSPPDTAQQDVRPQQPSQGDEQPAGAEDDQGEEADQRPQPEQGQGDSSQAQEVSASGARASASAAAQTETAPATPEPDEGSPVSVGASASAPASAPQSGQSGTAPPASTPATAQPAAAPPGGSGNPPAQADGGGAGGGAGGDEPIQNQLADPIRELSRAPSATAVP